MLYLEFSTADKRILHYPTDELVELREVVDLPPALLSVQYVRDEESKIIEFYLTQPINLTLCHKANYLNFYTGQSTHESAITASSLLYLYRNYTVRIAL